MLLTVIFFFFKQKTAYELRISDWSSDVCSSDLRTVELRVPAKNGGTVNQVAAKHYNPEKDANYEGLMKAVREARTDTFHIDMADAWIRHAEGCRTIAYPSIIQGEGDYAEDMTSRGQRAMGKAQ